MGFFSKDIKTMDDLFVHTLRDIYYAENQILKALPAMIDKASDASLNPELELFAPDVNNTLTVPAIPTCASRKFR